ncbi:hypothetical protein K2X92_02380 [Candidatus Gracilibacteria bacterium]|nr:hypothetical protein [Candidatus Gracilibacteria bacterium]
MVFAGRSKNIIPIGGVMVESTVVEEGTEVKQIKVRRHLELRQQLDAVNEITGNWINQVVQLAKNSNLCFYSFRKILSRVLQQKKLILAGYRKLLQENWYPAA